MPRPDGVPDRGEHLPGQPEPVAAVAVGAVVGQARVELAEQRPGPGVDLHPVGAGRDRQPGRGGEPGGQRGDLRVAHLHRHLAGDRVRDAGRSPQRRLGVGGGPLQAGMAEAGQHQRAVPLARRRDLLPAAGGRGGQRRPLVRPVGGVHRGRLGDDEPRPAGRPALVIGDVPGRERAAPGLAGRAGAWRAEVGLVRAEHDPGLRDPAGQRDRTGEPRESRGHVSVRHPPRSRPAG